MLINGTEPPSIYSGSFPSHFWTASYSTRFLFWVRACALIDIDFASASAEINFCLASSWIWTVLFLARKASCSAVTLLSIAFSNTPDYAIAVIWKSVTLIYFGVRCFWSLIKISWVAFSLFATKSWAFHFPITSLIVPSTTGLTTVSK